MSVMNATMESPSSRLFLRIFAFSGVALLTWYGWGHWGYSVFGDYALDMADALRFSQGDIPYRDFIPTYGPLHMVLTAPFFYLGSWGFPCLWLTNSAFILLQLLLLLRISSYWISRPWQLALLVLALTTMAFPPTNAKFILGYSPSGFLATFLFTLVLTFLESRFPFSCQRWFIAGICLGLIPFTKIDLGFTSFAVMLALGISCYRTAPLAVLGLVGAYAGTWLTGCLLLKLYGALPSLLLGSTLECFGQVVFYNDANLSLQIKLLIGAGGILIALLLTPMIRQRILCFERSLRPLAVFLLPTAILIDTVRTSHHDSLKQMVMFNWYLIVVFVLVAAHVIATILRKKSFRPLCTGHLVILVPLLTIIGMGILRVIASSWYPFNYFNPAVLLLGIFWASRQTRYSKGILRTIIPVILGLSLLLSLYNAIRGCRPQPFPLEWVSTPYGSVGFTLGKRQKETYIYLADLIRQRPGNGFLLCTYEPSLHILTGMRSPSLYTYFTRLGLTGRYETQRETQTLERILAHLPEFVVRDREVGIVHKRFGIEFGREIDAYIRKNYIVEEELNGIALLRKRVNQP